MLMEIIFSAFLIMLAIYLGKRIQEDADYLKRKFNKEKTNVEYTVRDINEEKGDK